MALCLVAYLTDIGTVHPIAFTASTTKLTPIETPVSTPTWPAPGEAALGAMGYGVVAQHSSGKMLATASTIKLLTALAVLRVKPLGPQDAGPSITLTAADVASYTKYANEGGSVVRVTIGEHITERQALEALLLPSANNMAETLARWAFGSIDAYLSYAGTLASQLDMQHTVITDPSGFLGTTTSTPHDLTLLGEAAMAQPIIAQVVQESTATIPVQGSIRNVNVLLGDDGIVGLKTGNNNQDPGCFIFAAKIAIDGRPITLVGAIMNAPTLGAALWDALPLITSARAGFHLVTVAAAAADVETIVAPWKARIPLVATTTLAIPVWGGTTIDAVAQTQQTRAPAHAGADAGTLIATDTLTGRQYSVTLGLQHALNGPAFFWRLRNLRI